MKTKLFIFFFFILFLSINSYAQQKNKYFILDSASMMQWHGGATWAPSGTTYEFHITFRKNCTARFDSVWITDEKSLPVKLITTSGWKAADSVFKKDSSYIITVQRLNPGSINYEYEKDIMEKGSAAPIVYMGVALIRCTANGKKYYCIAKSFRDLPSPQYP